MGETDTKPLRDEDQYYLQDMPADSRQSRDAGSRKRSLFAHIMLVFLLLNVIVLYILHFADRGGDTSDAVETKFDTSNDNRDGVTSASPEAGHAISFDDSGNLRLGAGSSVYLSAGDLPSNVKTSSFMVLAPMGSANEVHSTNLLAYAVTSDSGKQESVVTTVKTDAAGKELDVSKDGSSVSGTSVKDVASLSSSLAVMASATTSSDGMSVTTFIYPISLSDDGVKIMEDKAAEAANSITNYLLPLTESTFALIFFEEYSADKDYFQRAVIGSVQDDNIEMSDSVQFGQGNSMSASTTFGTPQTVFNSSDLAFVVPWFVDAAISSASDSDSDPQSSGLCLSMFTTGEGTNVSEPQDTCTDAYDPAYFVESTRISETQLILAFFDKANGYALTVVSVEFSPISQKPTFRGSYVIEGAAGAFDFGASSGFYPKPTLTAFGDQRLAVGFMNPSNSGKPSVQVLKYSSGQSIQQVSPVLPISNDDFSLTSADPKAFGSFIMDVLPTADGFMVSYAGSWANNPPAQRLAYVESMNRAVGIVSNADGADVKFVSSGTFDMDESVVAGNVYYAATNGRLYAPSTSTSGDMYVLADDNSIVISKDALVGYAVNDKSLFVAPKSN